jgi:heat shock protein HslJ
MKNINFIFFVFTVFLVFSSGCNNENKTSTKKMLNGKWMLKTINGKEVVKNKTGGNMPFLDFNLTAGTVSGFTGCNDLDGKISVTETEITFSDMSMSKIYCPDANYEYEIVGFLFHSEPINFSIYNDLLTLAKNEKAEMTFKKEK